MVFSVSLTWYDPFPECKVNCHWTAEGEHWFDIDNQSIQNLVEMHGTPNDRWLPKAGKNCHWYMYVPGNSCERMHVWTAVWLRHRVVCSRERRISFLSLMNASGMKLDSLITGQLMFNVFMAGFSSILPLIDLVKESKTSTTATHLIAQLWYSARCRSNQQLNGIAFSEGWSITKD